VRVVFVRLARGDGRIGLLSDEADWGIVDAGFGFVSYCSIGLFNGERLGDFDSVESFVLLLCSFLGRATKFPRRNRRKLFAGDCTRSST